MTNEQKAQAWYKEYGGVGDETNDIIAFAAFCLDKREVETGWRKYPDEKPEKDGLILTLMSDEFNKNHYGDKFPEGFLLNAWGPYKMIPGSSKSPQQGDVERKFYWGDGSVIAWMPLPEYKP